MPASRVQNRLRLLATGRDERFLRTFEFYLASCEASYEDRYNGNVQLLFSKPESRRAPILPPLER